jgi:hypothetical protein
VFTVARAEQAVSFAHAIFVRHRRVESTAYRLPADDGCFRYYSESPDWKQRQQIPSIMTSNAAEEELLLPQRRASKQADASDSACVLQNDK